MTNKHIELPALIANARKQAAMLRSAYPDHPPHQEAALTLDQAADELAAHEQARVVGDPVASDAFTKALSIRAAQGWELTGKAVPVLYTDAINGEQVCRDDLWICTTAALASPVAQPATEKCAHGVAREKATCGCWATEQAEAPKKSLRERAIAAGGALLPDGEWSFHAEDVEKMLATQPTAPAQDAQGVPVAYAVMLPSGRISRTRNTAERAQRHVDDWNARYPKPPHAYVAPLGVIAALRASSPADTRGTSLEKVPSNLHTFLDAAAGEGLVQGGVDAADLYVELFPKTYAAIVTKEST